MKKISEIVFDFGGVFYDIDFIRLKKAFEKLQIPEQLWENKQNNIFIQFEKGEMDAQKFLDILQLASPIEPSIDVIKSAFCSILVGMPVENVRYLRRFTKHYSCYLLSNTNEIHYEYFHSEIINNLQTREFYNSFKKEYYSHIMKMRKPESEIFEAVIQDNSLNPESTLFVDDMEENIVTARKIGFQTFHFGKEGKWSELINQFNIQV